MKKYLAATLIIFCSGLLQAQQQMAPAEKDYSEAQARKHCPSGFILDGNGNCVRLEADQLAE
jgi:uncharacterized protein YccT (UPF0319 family)